MAVELSYKEKRTLEKRFGIGIERNVLLSRSINDTFKVDSTNGTLALRRSSTNPYYGLGEADFEYDILVELGRKIKVITPVFKPLEFEDCIYFLTYWIEGNMASPYNTSPEEMGQYLGRLHQKLRGIKKIPSKPFSTDYINDLVQSSPDPYLDFRRYFSLTGENQIKERLLYLQNILELLKNTARVWGQNLNKEQLIHGDPRHNNFIQTGTGLVALDFQGIRHDYIVSDLGWCLTTGFNEFEKCELSLPIAERLLSAYLEVNPFADLSSFIELIKLRHLRSLDTIYYYMLVEKRDKPELFKTEEKSLKSLEEIDSKDHEIKGLLEKLRAM